MKARDSIPKYEPKLREYANFARRSIVDICKNIGGRAAGSDEELRAQKYLIDKIGDSADESHIEEFKFAPYGLFSITQFGGILLTIALIVYRFYTPERPVFAWITLALALAEGIMIIFEIVLYRQFVDVILPKKISHNAWCVRHPSGEVKRRIILGGHVDSSWEWNYNHRLGNVGLILSVVYPVVGMFYLVLLSILSLIGIAPGVINILGWCSFAFLPGFIGICFYINHKIVVPGANDNLTGTLAVAAVMKYLGDNDIRFENTEYVAFFSGAEESGLRGTKNFVKTHLDYLTDPDVETVYIAIDTLKDYDDMLIYNKDMSGLVKHDERVVDLVIEAGTTAGVEMKRSVVWAGSSDAVAFSQARVPAACLAAMDPGPPRYYHTRNDNWDIMELKTIEKGIDLALETVFLFDEKGLK